MVALYKSFDNKKYGKFLENIFPDLVFWTIIILLFTFTLDWNTETLQDDLRHLFINFIPYTIVVYLNFFIFRFFLLKKKYILFISLIIIAYTFSYYIIQWIRETYIPERYDDIIFAMFLYSFMYIGFRYLITAPREIMKFKTEETKRIQAERDLQELEAKHTKAELEVLKSQVNPHFLFNSLNNIYSLTMIDPNKAGESILTLSDLMRYNLESSKKKFVTLKHEVEFIDNYIQLESLRVDEICTIHFEVENNLKNLAIAPMILISFVENCFKHGISSDAEQNFIDISVKLEENTLHFKTKNNIARARMDITKKNVNIGIENVKRRLELLYQNKYKLEMKSENGIFSVDLLIEL